MRFLQVPSQVVGSGRSHRAVRATVRLLAGVGEHVSSEMVFLPERPVTVSTF